MAKRIKQLRRAAGLSQNQLARKAGVPVTTLRDWEYGRRTMRLQAAIQLADALALSLDDLVGRRPPKGRG
jgi:transcriptional regulator with XRE-family HTH domain